MWRSLGIRLCTCGSLPAAPDLDVFVYLEEVDRSGKSTYITEGDLRASHRKLSQAPFNNLGLPYQTHDQSDLLADPERRTVRAGFQLAAHLLSIPCWQPHPHHRGIRRCRQLRYACPQSGTNAPTVAGEQSPVLCGIACHPIGEGLMIIDAHAHAAREYSTAESIKDMAKKYEIEKIVLCTSPKNNTGSERATQYPVHENPRQHLSA